MSIYSLSNLTFVGLKNYWTVLRTKEFWSALVFTFEYTFGAVALEFVLGFLIALLLNRKFRGLNLCRSLLILPMVIAPILASVAWKTALDSTNGIVNYLLKQIGIRPAQWLTGIPLVKFTVMMVDAWTNTPYLFFVITSGLQSIPEDYNEVARIEGAGKLQKFWYVTLPTLKPVLLLGLIFRTRGAFRSYDLIYGLTSGGPGSVTSNASYYAYKLGFKYNSIGQGAAVSTLLLIIIMLICVGISSFMNGLWSKDD